MPLVFVKCTCSHLYANPQPTYDELNPFYQGDYHQYQHAPKSADQIAADTRGFHGERFIRIRVVPGGRYLDIGCGLGDTVAQLAAVGMKAQGVEVSSAAVEIARGQGRDVFHGTLNDAAFDDETFDSMTFFHVLEHVQDPVDLLRTAARILRRDGELLVVVPNADSMMFGLLKDLWMNVDVPRHVHFFTPNSLREAADRAGLSVAQCETESLPWSIEVELNYWLRHRLFIPGRVWNWTGLLKPLARRLATKANASGRGEVVIAHLVRQSSDRVRRSGARRLAGASHTQYCQATLKLAPSETLPK